MSCCATAMAIDAAGLPPPISSDHLLAASHVADDGSIQSDFFVPDMHCAACIRTIESGLGNLPDVISARANLSTRRVSVIWRPTSAVDHDFLGALADLGFKASIFDLADIQDKSDDVGRRLLLCLAVAGFALANIMLLSVSMWSGADQETAKLFQLISGIIAVPAVLFAGQPFFASAVSSLQAWRLNMDVPISLAVLLALGMSIFESLAGNHETYFDAAVMLLFFLLIGRYLDHMMRDRARSAVMHLAKLVPQGATLVGNNGRTAYTPLNEINIGDTLLIAAGERIPVNGRVTAGASDLDRSLVTGESTPVSVETGVEVEAGVLNLTGPVQMTVTKPADKSFIAEVVQMMEAAEQSKSRYVRIADRAAQIYAPAVHLLAVLTFTGWMVASGGDWRLSLYTAIAVLIITCPCALGLAVPIAQVVAANRLFRSGMLVKDGAALEKLCEVDMAVFDKTGTLTLGTPHITSIDGGTDAEHAVAGSLARLSSHPAARAIATNANKSPAVLLSDISEHPGFGIEAIWNGENIRLGRRSWVSEIANKTAGDRPTDKSEVCFAVSGRDLVTYALTDTLRQDAAKTISLLREAGYGIEILSGDATTPVNAVAIDLGIKKASAELDPADKIARIRDLQSDGHKVLYVGDGLNDAPALAAAHVSIAPSTGADVGRQSADLVFTGEGLGAINPALRVARRTNTIVRQNFVLAVLYNCIAVPIAVTGNVTPLIAALAMSGSSIVVVANSLRLNLTQDDGASRRVRENGHNTTCEPNLEAIQ